MRANDERVRQAKGSDGPSLTPPKKAVYALGDFTINTALASLSLIYVSYYLTQVAGLRPALAGLVPLIGRGVDAITDPLMGRVSDLTPWRAGRRRPYFLIGAAPFGLSFAMLWLDAPFSSQAALFAYYASIYSLLCVCMTVLSVPYLALLPEMATDYDARTSVNTYRNVGSLLGILAAISIRPVAAALGGGSVGYTAAGVLFGIVLALPWFAVHRVTFERPAFRARASRSSFGRALATVARHRTFRQLMGLYISGRIAMDVLGALLILWVTYWIGRSTDFEIIMLVFLLTVILSLPVWLRVSYGRDKARLFIVGALWWMTTGLLFALAKPEWPRWVPFVAAALSGVGYALVDLMPWAMLGEVIDEDDATTGERREGLYNGIFTFVRKLGGALGVFAVLGVLDLAGFQQGSEQSETARQTIRALTAGGPFVLLALAVWLARGYPLTRARHAGILAAIAQRDAEIGSGDGTTQEGDFGLGSAPAARLPRRR